MNQYPSVEITAFLREVDKYLSGAQAMIIIGGAAATLAYRSTMSTRDIDTVSTIPDDLLWAIERAREVTGHDIPVEQVGIFDAPVNYEDRIRKVNALRLRKLAVYVPERHDLACMKILRGEEHDLQVIAELHTHAPFEFDVLCRLFLDEMKQVTGRLEDKRLNFLGMIQLLFGDELAETAEALTEDWAESARNPDINS